DIAEVVIELIELRDDAQKPLLLVLRRGGCPHHGPWKEIGKVDECLVQDAADVLGDFEFIPGERSSKSGVRCLRVLYPQRVRFTGFRFEVEVGSTNDRGIVGCELV